MSFILDALKKSEIERQRQNVPGLMDSGPAPRRARFPLWAVALVALARRQSGRARSSS